ncbi:MucR family transcriptional regulator [Hyphomicrobiales bacterium]|jgi:predicted transcriptional regulator|nr:MucR family transcriptional regulator [Hyphomicrobiales bacterium]CAH1702538.1 Transcriptional regulatory protein ros [Hyphomicrobiales bacterium]CAI0346741.1 MucR family transcriptional regulator [Hyphomicrobiales bacterium]
MDKNDLVDLTASIVAAYVSHNSLPRAEIGQLITETYGALSKLNSGEVVAEVAPQQPAVPVKKSVSADFITCLEDGKKFKSLKRHLRSAYDMSPEEYRTKWNLPADYPMVAPNYAEARSNLAKKMGLGRKATLGRKAA